MNQALYNPVYNALLTGDAHLNLGRTEVKYFDPEVSPFAGFDFANKNGFEQLYEELPAGRTILFATPEKWNDFKGWTIRVFIEGLQFILKTKPGFKKPSFDIIPLTAQNSAEMVALATLTKPGPFNSRTIEFGHYHGIFEKGKLVAMTGQRLHVEDFTELSAVCTHPDHLGKGYAAALMHHQLQLIESQGKKAFLHVRSDNKRAIDLYERLGFTVSRPMYFYFLRKG